MTATDFANSYMTWFGPRNNARIQLDAACTITNEASGQERTFYLIAPCRSESCYVDGQLFKMPNYEFCGIWSEDDFLTIRTHWVSERDNRVYGVNREHWEEMHLDIRHFDQAEELPDRAEIVAATFANRPLIARTELRDETSRQRAVLEYPVKTMNVLPDPPQFQVDTGPLIVPDFGSTAEHLIECLQMAYVVYQDFAQAEFILRQPVVVPSAEQPATETTDYSVIQTVPARNAILAPPAPA
ncbi:MAG: hypothetical protein CL878_09830 [Dehalococcoidia bacterium]|nr:hypothetical protein [Dehalococcoidia bacterium]